MGLFSSLKHIVGGIGDVVKVASPLASFIPGVGPLVAAGIGAGGAALGKLNDKHVTFGNTLGSIAGGAAIGGLGGAGVDKLQGLSAANGGGVGGLLSGLTHGNGIAGAASSASGGSGLVGQILNFAKQNPALVLGGAQALSSAGQQSHASDMQNQALSMLREQYASRQPLYNALLKRLSETPATPDVSGIFHDPNNPF